MKIGLKNLGPYLPFELECIIIDGSVEAEKAVEMVGVNIDYVTLDALNKFDYNFDEITPIFQRIEDMTPEFKNKIRQEAAKKYNMTWIVIDHMLTTLVNTNIPIDYRIKKSQKWLVDLLLEDHYDIFEFIPLGLAIDKNTFDHG